VLAELILVIEKRCVVIDLSHMVAVMKNFPGFSFTSLSPQIVLRSQSLAVLPDIHDRLIVAEALEIGTALITRDRRIQESNLVQTVW
jgi:PIN domain nuclease of toxin-antitoxin system